MIHIALNGRLANNIFQFMMGEALRNKGYIISYIASTPQHKEFIGLFDLGETTHITNCGYLAEEHMGYNENIFNIIQDMDKKYKDIILVGYWQNFKYVSGIECQVRDKLRSKLIVDSPYKVDNVIHVRGTDYKGWSLFDICKSPYYREAFYRSGIKNGVVITDDKPYAEELLADLLSEHFVISYTDELLALTLLSKAKVATIPNSSFSMIGSWLGEAKTIAPNPWFGPTASYKESRIYPYHDRCALIEV